MPLFLVFCGKPIQYGFICQNLLSCLREAGEVDSMDEQCELELRQAQLSMIRNKLVLRESQCDYLRMRMARHERRIKELSRIIGIK